MGKSSQLSVQLRQDTGSSMNRRREIIGLTLFSCGLLGTVALYQVGLLKKLPEPPSKWFNTEKVNGSAEAYSMFGVPDAFLGLASFSVTACLAAMGSPGRSKTHPLIPLAMGVKLLADAAFAGKLTLDECRKFHAFSLLSVLTAASTVAALPLAYDEVRAAFCQMKSIS